ncbi:uncharacterized protein Z518_01546 [Rhinocladiella mackenziei CBS 650.93]|uniref:DUF2423 domain-containing protein n=1 Tax=Rhinocladiella mackenziei CBS 650.93 TaxID=1442369 RepID=A0A0D2HIH5_9EURO|nr:uncharacterized protein Z518_01546 [Rhinocladiella mackenziei CBS 650.93]KIX10463.1 hypothetical protein Z518_01546 [Rhinocladiella mackenziei CBS 650.93]
MAKSARASVTKRNHRNLRAKVFGPAHDARTERLSAKLQELATKPRPNEDKAMDVDVSAEQEREQPTSDNAEAMEVDGQGVNMKPVKSRSEKTRSSRKVHKVSKRKAKNHISFPSERARRNKIISKKSKR